MKPIIAIVGRPNVGKSTLFNRLTRTRDALVADVPGLTRDRHYGEGRLGDIPFLIIDTGGFEPIAKEGITYQMARQAQQAVLEADLVFFVVDGRQGLTPQDQNISDFLRKSGKPVLLVINKAEGMRHTAVTADFYILGWSPLFSVSSAHGDGVRELLDHALIDVLKQSNELDDKDLNADDSIKIAVVGRPNVGKSTLINTLLGEERVIAFDAPGTTRDAIEIPFERNGQTYTLIDTAGLRKRGKVFEAIEKFSVVKTLQSISEANVVILMLDAHQEIAEQDAHIAGFILESGRALVIAVNKWDGLDEDDRDQIRNMIAHKLGFLSFAQCLTISALYARGIGQLLNAVDAAFKAAMKKLPTPQLTRSLYKAVEHQTPRRQGLIRPKLRYAHQGGQNPPIVVIHGTALDAIEPSYRRYLENHFRKQFELTGTPLRIEFRSPVNPYAKNK